MVTVDIAENDLTKMIEEFSIFERKKECWNRFCRMSVFYFNVGKGCYWDAPWTIWLTEHG
ncbi:MAG: hypothetical protein ACXQT5_03580 [Candidatus Syntropharchaeia archaeon]